MLDFLASLVPMRYWVRGCKNPGRCDHSPVWHLTNLTPLGRRAMGMRGRR